MIKMHEPAALACAAPLEEPTNAPRSWVSMVIPIAKNVRIYVYILHNVNFADNRGSIITRSRTANRYCFMRDLEMTT